MHPPPEGARTEVGASASRARAAALAFVSWEDEMETLCPQPVSSGGTEVECGAQIALHHFLRGCFLPDEGVLPEVTAARTRLGAVPCIIIQGRHDVVCPPVAAFELHLAWPGSRYSMRSFLSLPYA